MGRRVVVSKVSLPGRSVDPLDGESANYRERSHQENAEDAETQEIEMAERVLRGSRLGTTSYETDRNTDLAPRREVVFVCPAGHLTGLPMAADAELPASWECRTCGAAATLRDGAAGESKAGKPTRTHWDMLLERRSIDDLEDVLNERLAELHQSHRKTA
jgi:hypothetical protein